MWMPPRLNSRNIEAEDEIFNGGPLRSIARARRLATIQRWNVPEVCMHRSSDPCVVLFLTALRCVCVDWQEPDPTPAKITINVQTECEGESVTMSRNDSLNRVDKELTMI